MKDHTIINAPVMILKGVDNAVIRSDTLADHPANRTPDWFLSQEGQNVVEMSGYVPVSAN